MPGPNEICIEDLDISPDDERYIRCTALPGGEPGLALDRAGVVRWMPDGPAAYGLWVSADDRLVLQRGEEAGPITVARGGRSLEAPVNQPVVLLDGDLLLLDGRRLRVHLHGPTDEVHPPERLTGSALARLARSAAAALAVGAAVAAGTGAAAAGTGGEATQPIEVRARPPAPRRVQTFTCAITDQKLNKKGLLTLHARCVVDKPQVGAVGVILDPKTGGMIKGGTVHVKSVKGDKVVGETKLTKRVEATQIRFNKL